jgi:site-specific recombinase XerD
MKKPSYSIVYNRKNKLKDDGTALVQIRVYHNYKLKFYGTGVSISPDQWDPDKHVINHKDAHKLNRQIRETLREVESYEYKALADNQPYNITTLPGTRNTSKDFLDYIKHHIEKEPFAQGTRRQHRSTLNHLINFGKIISFQDVNLKSIQALDKYLQKKINEQSSIYGQHKRIKRWIRKAINEGYITQDPYLQFKSPSGNRDVVRYLSPSELLKLEQTTIHSERLQEIRDIFLFSCYTGLAYQELHSLQPSNITKEDDGTIWLSGERLKVSQNSLTGATGYFTVPLHQKAVDIINKYEGARKDYCLPVISNQQYNVLLKEVQGICSIPTTLTSHIARHTFATTFTLAKGVSMESVKEMLGHSSIRMTEKYAKVLKIRVKEDMKKIL